MCGRYYIPGEDDELEAMIAAIKQEGRAKTGEIFPADAVLALDAQGKPALMRWGFSRYDGKGLTINARSETAGEKSMFARLLRESRCLLPAGGYFEWRDMGGAKKQKYAISQMGRTTLYMAGLYRMEAGGELPSFVILTRPAAPGLAHIHNRMPVILPAAARALWLGGGEAGEVFGMAGAELVPFTLCQAP